jgi:hypothetical protein
MNSLKRWLNKMGFGDRRRVERRLESNLIAYFWEGSCVASKAHHVRNTSTEGLYMMTDQRWYPGTLIMMTLQSNRIVGAKTSIKVQARVIWSGEEGVGFEFVFPQNPDRQLDFGWAIPDERANKKTLSEFLKGLQIGNAQVFAQFLVLMLPDILLIVGLRNLLFRAV